MAWLTIVPEHPNGWEGFDASNALTDLLWRRLQTWHYLNFTSYTSTWEDRDGSGSMLNVTYSGERIVELTNAPRQRRPRSSPTHAATSRPTRSARSGAGSRATWRRFGRSTPPANAGTSRSWPASSIPGSHAFSCCPPPRSRSSWEWFGTFFSTTARPLTRPSPSGRRRCQTRFRLFHVQTPIPTRVSRSPPRRRAPPAPLRRRSLPLVF